MNKNEFGITTNYPPSSSPLCDGRNLNVKNEFLNADDTSSIDSQGSLTLCEELLEKDGSNFMENNMDLTPYLVSLVDADDQFSDDFIKKQHILHNDAAINIQQQQQQHYQPNTTSFPQYTDLSNYERRKEGGGIFEEIKEVTPIATPPIPIAAAIPTPVPTPTPTPVPIPIAATTPNEKIIKEEVVWDDDSGHLTSSTFNLHHHHHSDDLSSSASIVTTATTSNHSAAGADDHNSSSGSVDVNYTPTIKPRKYSLKPEAEKRNPLYRLKREKNNDAVRKSRSKAKEQQKLREKQMQELEGRVEEMKQLICSRDERIKFLESLNAQLTNENRRLKNARKKISSFN